ncbi:MAG: RHS repeat-associated core domain-containing protein, partial [Candidatus Promineifilaceae bacterium]
MRQHSISVILRRSRQPRNFLNWVLVFGLVLQSFAWAFSAEPVSAEPADDPATTLAGASHETAMDLLKSTDLASYLPDEVRLPFADNDAAQSPFAFLSEAVTTPFDSMSAWGDDTTAMPTSNEANVLEQVAAVQQDLDAAPVLTWRQWAFDWLRGFNREWTPISTYETIAVHSVNDSASFTQWLPIVLSDASGVAEPPAMAGGRIFTSPDERVTMEIPAINDPLTLDLNYATGAAALRGLVGVDGAEMVFSISAETASQTPVTRLRRPANLELTYDNASLTTAEAEKLYLHAYNPTLAKWQPLPTHIDTVNNTATAFVDHFTTFALAPSFTAIDPCAVDFELAPQDTFPFVLGPGGNYHNFSGEFTHFIGTDTYLLGRETPDILDVLPSELTNAANQIDTHDLVQILFPSSIFIKTQGQLPLPPQPLDTSLNGTYFPVFPPAPNTPRVMTHTLTIQISDNNSTTTTGSTGYYVVRDDVSNPIITEAWSQQNGAGGVYVQVAVYDNCAVDHVTIEYQSTSEGTWHSLNMVYLGAAPDGLGLYGAPLALPSTGVNSYRVTAYDMARPAKHTDIWETSELAAYSRVAGEMFFNNCTHECGGGCSVASCGDPISTATGNFTIREEDANVPGKSNFTDLMVDRSYNAAGTQRFFYGPTGSDLGPFGLGWSSPQYFHLEVWDNLLMTGAKVVYPDGHSARFEGASGQLAPLSPNESDTLEKAGGGYVLRRKDLTEHRFNADGQLLESKDVNGNTLTYSPSAAGPTEISNNAGRSITIGYTSVAGHDMIATITDGSGLLSLSYTYETVTGFNGLGEAVQGVVLKSMTDSRGKTTNYFYDGDHRLIEIRTPKGHSHVQMTYDAQGRANQQTVGEAEVYTFSYDDAAFKRTVTDANGYIEMHQYDGDYRLTSLTDNRGFTESYTYNGENLRETVTNKRGVGWSYTYDARHNLLSTTGPLGTTTYTYNGQDRPVTVTDAANRTTTFDYDGNGNLTSITNADSKTMSIAYNGNGQPTTITDYNNNTIVMTYNGTGDLETLTNGAAETVRFAYDGLGRMVTMTTHETHAYTFAYEGGSELLLNVSGPLGYNLSYTYDDNGNLATETDARSNTTIYTFDDSENLETVTDALNGVITFDYGPMNNLRSLEDEGGGVTTYDYDETYNLTTINAPENRTTTFVYDEQNNLTQLTDAEGRITNLVYDNGDRLVTITDALNGVTTIGYDAVSNITSIEDAENHQTNYVYDVLNRLITETDAEMQVTSYAYDDNGNLLTVTDAETNVTTLTYDGADRLVTITNAEAEVVTFAYDSLGNIIDLTQPNGVKMHWTYDGLYRPIEMVQNYQGSGVTADLQYTFAYDLNSNLTQVIDPENNVSTFAYDELNRLISDTNALNNVMTYEYDAGDNLTKVTDRRMNETTLAYDMANRLTTATDADNGVSSYTYDKVDNLLTYTDARTNTVTLTYDNLDRLKTVTNPEGHAVSFEYDAVGNMEKFTDGRGADTVFVYDDVNRLKTYTDARSGVTTLTYDRVGNVVEVQDANSHTTAIEYDKAYRTTKVTDAENYTTLFAYDDNGNTVKVTDGNGHDTNIVYDPLDRIDNVTNAEAETTRYTYDGVGNLVDIIEADGITKRYGYDKIYQLTDVTLNAGGVGGAWEADVVYDYSYDENGNLTQIKDPRNSLTQFDYDVLNRVEKETNPLTDAWVYTYDAVGNLATRTDANNHVTTYSYYPDDQLQTIAYDDGDTVSFSYDENNNLTNMVDWLGTTTFAYDELNRVASVDDALGRELQYGYDAVGNVTSMTYPNGGTVTYNYLDNDWLETLTDTAGGATTYTRNGVGQMLTTEHSNGTFTEATYDDASRMLSLGHYEDVSKVDVIQSTAYTLNEVGLRTSAETHYGRPWPKQEVELYEYDGLRRLVTVKADHDFSSGGDSSQTGEFEFRTDYEYDAAGNRTAWNVSDDQLTTVEGDAFSTTYTYNAANQLLQSVRSTITTDFTYDQNGNRTNKLAKDSARPQYDFGTDYDYDRADRLTSVENYRVNESLNPGDRRDREETTMQYDGMGRRLVKDYSQHDGRGRIEQSEYVFDGLDIVAEYPVFEDGEEVGRNNHRNEYYLNDQREIVTQRRFPNGEDAQTYQYHTDGRRDVVSLSDESARAWVHYDYDAYGQLLPEWGNYEHPEQKDHNQLTFGSKLQDENTNTIYFGSRDYESASGSWSTQDVYRGSRTNPQSLHRYGYVAGNSINFVDHYGFCSANPLSWGGCSDQVSDWADEKVFCPDCTLGVNSTFYEVTEPIVESKAGRFLGGVGEGAVDTVVGLYDLGAWATRSTSLSYAIINPDGFKEQWEQNLNGAYSIGRWGYRNSMINRILDPDDYEVAQYENCMFFMGVKNQVVDAWNEDP